MGWFQMHNVFFLSPSPNSTPKPTPHTKLQACSHSQNTSFCDLNSSRCYTMVWYSIRQTVSQHQDQNQQNARQLLLPSNRRWRSARSLKSTSSVMEEWKRTPVTTCEALVNSMPKRVKAVLENNGGHTTYLHFGHFYLGVYSLLRPSG